MKNKLNIAFFGISLIILSQLIIVEDDKTDVPFYEWIDKKDLKITENGVYIDTNKGFSPVEVKDYDEEGDRYLIDCRKAFN